MIASTFNNFAVFYRYKDDLETSLSFLQESLKIRQNIGDLKGQATVLQNIGDSYVLKQKFNVALDYISQSLSIEQSLGNLDGVATSLRYTGIILFDK